MEQDSSRSVPQRFVGYLNPETVFLDQTERAPDRQTVSHGDRVGVWLDKRELDSVFRREGVISHDTSTGNGAANDAGPDVATRNRRAQESAVLEISDQDALIAIYFSGINPLFPILHDEESFSRGRTEGHVSSILILALCLVTAKDFRAEPYLRLRSDPTVVMKPRDFARRMYASITEALKSDVKIEKVTLIRILALTSLHSEGPDGAEESSLHLAQAIHHAQTIGLHIGRSDESRSDPAMGKLFWCLWGLDKLNAAINGRSVMISDYDLGVSRFATGKEGDAAFEVLLELLSMLNKVIDLYRPATSPAVTGWEDEYPAFEAIVDRYSGWKLSSSLLGTLPVLSRVQALTVIKATLELLYLLIALLSHRSRSLKDKPLPTPSYIRQSLSALQITSHTTGDTRKHLHAVPFVPYAVSLALSVGYRRLRQSQLLHQQESAMRDFRACCETLRVMRRWWWSADVMAALACRVLDEVDKVAGPPNYRACLNNRGSAGDYDGDGSEAAQDFLRTSSPDAQLRKEQSLSTQTSLGHSLPTAINGARSRSYHAAFPATSSAESCGDTSNKRIHMPDHTSGVLNANFDGIDDIFGAYLDPNFPVNFDDFVFADHGAYGGWNDERAGYYGPDVGG